MEKNNYLKRVEWDLSEFSRFSWVSYLGCITLIFHVLWLNFLMYINFVRRYKVFHNLFPEPISPEFYASYLFSNIIIICKVDTLKIRKICFKYKLWWHASSLLECNEVSERTVLDIARPTFVISTVWPDFSREI